MMPNFTQAEIDDARRNPRPGDVWTRGNLRRCISSMYTGGPFICQRSSTGKVDWVGPSVKQFEEWTLNATLVRRGHA